MKFKVRKINSNHGKGEKDKWLIRQQKLENINRLMDRGHLEWLSSSGHYKAYNASKINPETRILASQHKKSTDSIFYVAINNDQ